MNLLMSFTIVSHNRSLFEAKIKSDKNYIALTSLGVRNFFYNDWATEWIWDSNFASFDAHRFFSPEIPYPDIADFKALSENIPSIDSFYPKVKPAFEKFLTKVDDTVYGFSRSAELFREQVQNTVLDVRNIPSLLPEDYNPPEYIGSNSHVVDLEYEKELHSNISQVRKITLKVCLFLPAISLP